MTTGMRDNRQMGTFFYFRALWSGAAATGLSDAELLQRFVDRRGAVSEAAFDVLISRHGPMVLGVCQRVLRDQHDVEDAFQATFLILVHKARSVRAGKSLGPWLYRVARRVAVAAKVNSDRRRIREDRGIALVDVPAPMADQENLSGAIDEELDRLPRNFRAVIRLCLMEGLTTEAAAERLRCPVGTVRSRLARGRVLLRERLTRRGLAQSILMLNAALPAPETPLPLVRSTVRVAMLVAAGEPLAASSISAEVVTLMRGAMKAMFLTKIRVALGVLLSLGLVGAGITGFAGLASSGGRAGDEQERTPDLPARLQVAIPSAAPTLANAPVLEALQATIRSVEAVNDDAQRVEDTKADALLAIATAQTRLGDTKASVATLQRAVQTTSGIAGEHAESIRPKTLVRIAKEQVNCGDATAARETLRQALQSASEIKDDLIRADVLWRVAEGQVEAGDLASARESLRRAIPAASAVNRSWMKPFNLGRIAATLAHAGDPTAAAGTFRLALEAAKAIDDPRSRAIALRNVAASYAGTKDFDAAFRVAESIEGDQRIGALQAIADAAQEGAQAEVIVRRALEQAALRAKEIESTQFKAQTLSAIAFKLARLGDLAGALLVVESIPRHGPNGAQDNSTQLEGMAARTLAEIARTVSAKGDRPRTLRIARQALENAQAIGSEQERPLALADVAVALTIVGDQPGAQAALREATRLSLLQDEPRRSRSLSRIASSQAQAGDFDGALRSAESIAADRPSEKIGALELVSRAQQGAGKKEAARQSLQRALQLAIVATDRLPHVQEKPAEAANAQAENAGARTIGLDEEAPTDAHMVWLVSETAFLQAQLGDAKAAIATSSRLGKNHEAHLVANIAIRFLAAGHVLAALSLVSALDPPDTRLRAIKYVSAAIARGEGSDRRPNVLGGASDHR